MKRGFHFTFALGHVALALVAIIGFGALVMLLWNWLMPAIFGLACISIWQALGLLVLARVLFGGMGAGHFWRAGHRRNPIHEKWARMTPEERKEFVKRHHFQRGFGHAFFREEEAEKQE
ncbi:MAG: hypothetical protein LBK12_01840 [Odoribacteraceae bacterium]|jgi:hypothetical protein|nr:hypothetical protein [Odoribacteraceae bacterium]